MEATRNAAGRGESQVVFRLPEELVLRDDARQGDRYELWSVQLLGDGLTLQDLEGADGSVDIELSPPSAPGDDEPTERLTSTSFQVPNGATTKEFVIQLQPNGSPHQNEAGANDSMRLVFPAKRRRREGSRSAWESSDSSSDSDNDDDDDDDDNDDNDRNREADEFSYQPHPQPFSRHCSIISHCQPADGPSSTSPAPAIATMRRAYEPVPQRSGLKRRWVPFGGSSALSRTDRSADMNVDVNEASTAASTATTADFPGAQPTPSRSGGTFTHHSLKDGTRNPRHQQEAGQTTAAVHAPSQQSTSTATSEPARDHLDGNAAERAADKASRKDARKQAKKSAKKEAKKKDKKRSREEGSSS